MKANATSKFCALLMFERRKNEKMIGVIPNQSFVVTANPRCGESSDIYNLKWA